MSIAQARQRLGKILSRVLEGEDIGNVHAGTGKITALRPMEDYNEDYPLIEYGLKETEMKRAVRNLNKKARNEKPIPWGKTAKSLRR